MKAAGHGVPAATELAPCVQDGENHLDRGLALAGHDVDRDTATVVDHAHPTVSEQGDVDGVAVARKCFIDGVIDHFVDKVVQTALTRGSDVHAGTLAYCVETFEDGDGARVVGHGWVTLLPMAPGGRRAGGATRADSPAMTNRSGGRPHDLWGTPVNWASV